MKRTNRWHLMDSGDVLNAFGTDMNTGLSSQEAKKRGRYISPLWYVKRKTLLNIVTESCADLTTVLMIVAAFAAAFSDKNVQAGIIAGILVLGAVIRIFAGIASSRILEKAAESRIPVTNVLRDGSLKPVSANRIVTGDIIVLSAGDTVPCDARVISDYESSVRENGITSNKEPVHKFNSVIKADETSDVPCEFRSNMVFAGSLVLSGSICAVATSCGLSTLIGRKQGGVGIIPEVNSGITERLRRFGTVSGVVMVAVVFVIFAVSLFIGKYTLAEIFLPALALMSASISEFLPTVGLFITSAVVMSLGRADENGGAVTVRKPEKIDTVAGKGCALLCGSRLFKSGKSELYAFRTDGVLHRCAEVAVHGDEDGNPADNENKSETEEVKAEKKASPEQLLSLAYAAACGQTSLPIASGLTVSGDRASGDVVRVVASAVEAYGSDRLTPPTVIDHVNSSAASAFRMEISMAMRGNEPWIVSCGRISDVIKCCSYELVDGREVPIDENRKRDIFVTCATVECDGAAVVAVAVRKSPYNILTRLSGLINGMTFVGFIASAEEPLTDVVGNVARMKECGRYPVLLSEYPLNDLYYCRRIGLFGENTKTVSGADITVSDIDNARENGLIISIEGADGFNRADMITVATAKLRELVSVGGRNENVVSLVSDVRDSDASASADCAFTVSSGTARIPSNGTAKDSFAIVRSSGEKGSDCGGFIGFVRALCACRKASKGALASCLYLSVSGGLRILAVLLAMFVPGFPMLTPAAILVWGELLDLAAVAAIAAANK